MLSSRVFWQRLSVVKSGTAQFRIVQPLQALDELRLLPESKVEKHRHRQGSLDRGIAVVGLSTAPTGGRRIPGHERIEPDLQRPTMLERLVIGEPVQGYVGSCLRSAHLSLLPCWIHKMNPSCDLINRAYFIAFILCRISDPN